MKNEKWSLKTESTLCLSRSYKNFVTFPCKTKKGPSIKYVGKLFRKTNISNPLVTYVCVSVG